LHGVASTLRGRRLEQSHHAIKNPARHPPPFSVSPPKVLLLRP
jgi:hypothetical protein